MMEKTKMRDILKSACKETPDSFRNSVNKAVIENMQTDSERQQLSDN